MKNFFLLCISLGTALSTVAEVKSPEMIPEFYSTKISADGSVILSQVFDAITLYNTATNEVVDFETSFLLGNGNCITADGTIVVGGTESITPIMVVNGEIKDLNYLLEKFDALSFNGINAEGTRVSGIAINPSTEPNETTYVPVYFDINADGSLSDVHYLPYPAKDWTNRDIQRASADYVSADGRTIVGQVVDFRGMELYPIVYKCDDKGDWTYTLPTADLINPNHLPIPEEPEELDVPYPEISAFMTPEEAAAYQAAYDEWVNSGYEGEYPEPGSYMSEDEINAFNEAVDDYNAKSLEYNEKFATYYEKLQEIIDQSYFFLQNGFTMSADGTTMALNRSIVIDNPDPMSWIPFLELNPTYLLNLDDYTLTEVKNLENGLFPLVRQILSDGTIIGVSQNGEAPMSFVLLPETDEYIPLEDYYATLNPTGAAWLKENMTKEVDEEVYNEELDEFEIVLKEMFFVGHCVVSDDWSVLSGGVYAYMYSLDDTYESYVIFAESKGVSSALTESELLNKTYYNLNGIEVKEPSNGIFIERAKFSDGSVVAAKKVIK
ncbi:MAG: hypothetical protein K2M19_06650 [Muribaculaceae bacterium]|nr:hypothetical protein [Muribaculaceae bacterium]